MAPNAALRPFQMAAVSMAERADVQAAEQNPDPRVTLAAYTRQVCAASARLWPILQLIDEAARRGLVLMVDHTFVYTGAVRSDLGDMRVFNGDGAVVPFAFVPRAAPAREKRAPVWKGR